MDKDETTPKSDGLIVKGIFYSNLFAVTVFALTFALSKWSNDAAGSLSFAEFILVPLVMGIIAMKFWIKLGKRFSALVPYTILNTVIALALSMLFMGEGVICLIIVSPLILVFMWLGVIIGKYLFVNQNTTLKTSTFFVFVILFAYDTFSEHHYTNMVSDEIIINAPKEVVWKYVAQHPVNNSKSSYWLFNMGLPCPVQSTVTSQAVGAQRKCFLATVLRLMK